MSAFDRLHPTIQRWLYDQRWTELRPVQVQAIEAFASSERDLIITAPTAGGKTEAAFFPVLSAIAPEPRGSVRAVYIGPLKALINDQFRRCEDLCLAADIPVHRWHGDVRQSEKRQLIDDPSGVLLITPESVESLLINRSSQVRAVFSGLRAIVIDELHVFPGSDRGLHLRSLLHRVDMLAGKRVRRIGLSATLGEPERVCAWLNPLSPKDVELVADQVNEREVRTRIHAYVADPSAPVEDAADTEDEEVEDLGGPPVPPDAEMVGNLLATPSGMPTATRMVADLLRHHDRGVNLVFANAKRILEQTTVTLRQLLADERLPEDTVLIHHGSLSRDIREEAEALLHEGRHRICLCSSTLELGIDIGAVQAVGQIGAPWSVASLAQRLGRSGRRAGDVPTLRQYIAVRDPADTIPVAEDPIGSLELELVRAAATMSLHLERWCEPLRTTIRDVTVRLQQTLSLIAQYGGIRADRLYEQACAPAGVGPMPKADFTAFLRHIAAQNLIEQLPNGDLLLGPEGERLVNSREFYAVFMGGEGYKVINDQRRIGELPPTCVVAPEDGFVLAGRRWRVVQVDMYRREILVVPGGGKSTIRFDGDPIALHDRVVERMRSILAGRTDIGQLLDVPAARAMAEARAAYEHLNLDACAVTGDRDCIAWTWKGGATNRAIADLLRAADVAAEAFEAGVIFSSKDGGVTEMAAVRGVSDAALRVSLMAQALPMPGKYDHLAPVEQVLCQYMQRDIDVCYARQWLSAGLDRT